MSTYLTENIIDGLRNQDNEIIRFIYKTNYPVIEHLIKKNKGKKEDAKDIFQESLIIIYKKIINEGLVLTCSFSTFFYAVCEYQWHKILRKRKNLPVMYVNSLDGYRYNPGLNENIERTKLELYEFHFNRLSKDCQKILKLHFSGASIAEIMKKMGYNSKDHTMDRKYRCKKSLFNRIENDQTFKDKQDELF
jgi:DNA-directed RNA polymerase specialized sigma24 family protein